MSRANQSTGFFSGNKPRNPETPVTIDTNDTMGSVWHENTLITRPNGTQTALKNLAIGDRVRSLAPRAEWLGKMLNADGSYNPEAVWAVWEPGYPWSKPNPSRFAPEYIPTSGRVPNGNEFIEGEAEIVHLSTYGIINDTKGTAKSLFFSVYYYRESGPKTPETILSGSLIYSAMLQLAISPETNQFVFLPRNGIYTDWPNSFYTKTGVPNTFRLIMPTGGDPPTPADGTTSWNVASNRGKITKDSSFAPLQIGRYISMILKKVDADSSPVFIANGVLVF